MPHKNPRPQSGKTRNKFTQKFSYQNRTVEKLVFGPGFSIE
jgi:hypothetical protein